MLMPILQVEVLAGYLWNSAASYLTSRELSAHISIHGLDAPDHL